MNLKAPNIVVVWWMFGGRAAATSSLRQNGSRRYRGNRRGGRTSSKPQSRPKKSRVRSPTLTLSALPIMSKSRTSWSECQDSVLKGPELPLASSTVQPRGVPAILCSKITPAVRALFAADGHTGARRGHGSTCSVSAIRHRTSSSNNRVHCPPTARCLRFPAFQAITKNRTPYQFRNIFSLSRPYHQRKDSACRKHIFDDTYESER